MFIQFSFKLYDGKKNKNYNQQNTIYEMYVVN